ncbi:MAG: signal peptidase II [Patescibacteria group bacterium]|jgi:signal peptidase II
MKTLRITVLNLVIFILFAFDRLIKFYLLKNPEVIRDFKIFTLQFWQNERMAFSLDLFGSDSQKIISAITGVVILFLVYITIKEYQNKKVSAAIFLTIIILGALSNLIDRLAYGGVIDYINFNFWPVFNIADILIVVGAAGYCLKQFDIKKRTSN